LSPFPVPKRGSAVGAGFIPASRAQAMERAGIKPATDAFRDASMNHAGAFISRLHHRGIIVPRFRPQPHFLSRSREHRTIHMPPLAEPRGSFFIHRGERSPLKELGMSALACRRYKEVGIVNVSVRFLRVWTRQWLPGGPDVLRGYDPATGTYFERAFIIIRAEGAHRYRRGSLTAGSAQIGEFRVERYDEGG
jgi:hypothetical protein